MRASKRFGAALATPFQLGFKPDTLHNCANNCTIGRFDCASKAPIPQALKVGTRLAPSQGGTREHERVAENLETNVMKTALFVLCFLCATTALAQSAGGSVGSAPLSSTVQMASHAERASQQSLAQEQSLLEQSNYFYAQGERPLWEVQPLSKSRAVPLGDIARAFRKDHELVKKADIILHD